jgi:DNA-binding transcriptional regulator YiaG
MKTLPYRVSGLDYIYVIVPVARADDGTEYIDLPPNKVEKAIARKLIEARIPIRGCEVRFLRSALGMSLKDWGQQFGMSAAGVQKWEKQKFKRLAPANEAAVRSFCGEHLQIAVDGKWSMLVSKDKVPKKLSLVIRGHPTVYGFTDLGKIVNSRVSPDSKDHPICSVSHYI